MLLCSIYIYIYICIYFVVYYSVGDPIICFMAAVISILNRSHILCYIIISISIRLTLQCYQKYVIVNVKYYCTWKAKEILINPYIFKVHCAHSWNGIISLWNSLCQHYMSNLNYILKIILFSLHDNIIDTNSI